MIIAPTDLESLELRMYHYAVEEDMIHFSGSGYTRIFLKSIKRHLFVHPNNKMLPVLTSRSQLGYEHYNPEYGPALVITRVIQQDGFRVAFFPVFKRVERQPEPPELSQWLPPVPSSKVSHEEIQLIWDMFRIKVEFSDDES